MSRALVRLALSLALGGLSFGCMRAYKPPAANEPHALVKLRRLYPEPKGPKLREHFEIEDHLLADEATDATSGPRTQAVRVAPGPRSWLLRASYFHHETRLVREPHSVREPYTTTERYQCGSSYSSGNYSSPRYCSRTVTQYRTKTEYRSVWRTVEVSDGACAARARFTHVEGSSYLLQYRFSDNDVCSISCLEQLVQPDGSFSSRPCPMAAPEK